MLFRRVNQKTRGRVADDDGLALAAVIGVMAVGLLLTTLIASSVVAGLAQTTATRADVQSQASADAGIATARAAVMAGTCVGAAPWVFTSVTPAYTATVYRPSGASWVEGCPLTLSSAERVRIVSKGTASAKGVGRVTSGDVSTVEAILSGVVTTVTPGTPGTPGTTPLIPSGPAVYAFSSANFGGSGALHGSDADVMVKSGNVTCNGASSGISDLVAAGGNLTIAASCVVAGNVWASGAVALSGSVNIGGNIVANGVSNNNGSGTIGGSIWSTANVDLQGNLVVNGNVTASSFTNSGGSPKILHDAWVYGAATFSGNGPVVGGKLTAKSQVGAAGHVGSMNIIPAGPGPSPYATPTAPVVPNWVDLSYVRADWTGLGFTEYVYPVGCGTADLSLALTAFGTNKGVIDARNCTSVTVTGSATIGLSSDVAIIAKVFNFDHGGSFATSAAASKLWLITADAVADNSPTCLPGSSFTLDGNFTFDPNLTVLIYTPCLVDVSISHNFSGQIYAGQASIAGAANLTFVPVGVPGYNLSTGTTTTTPGTPGTPAVTTYTPRSLETNRNIPNG